MAKVIINDKIFGITTRGDNDYVLKDDFKTLGKCDLYICACAFRYSSLKNAYFEDTTTWKLHYGSQVEKTYTKSEVSDSEFMAEQIRQNDGRLSIRKS